MNIDMLVNNCNDEFDILCLESKMDINEAIIDYEKNNLIVSYEAVDATVNKGPFAKLIDGIISAIMRVVHGVIEFFSNIFGKNGTGDNLSPEQFLSSPTAKINMQADINAVEASVRSELNQGRKLVQAISRGTGISDDTVAKFVDGAENFLKKFGPVVITAGAAYAARTKIFKSMSNTEKELSDAAKLAKESENNITDQKLRDKAKSQITKVMQGMSTIVNHGFGLYREFGKQVNKLKK